ncbi:MAG: UPF0104 family protein [Candidatus Electrothrix sp. AR4]|nr:UPF0104 family protein [Candidatus Electrothrix sp. AR4]
MSKAHLQYGIKFFITGILLFIIFRSINVGNTITALREIPPQNLLFALFCQLACITVAAFRWCLIMYRLGFAAPFLFYLTSYFKGAFFNQGLPTSIGGDGLRIFDCSRVVASAEDAFYGVFIDRIIGLTGLLLLNISALIINHDLLPANVHYPLLFILTGLAVGLILLFFLRKFPFFAVGKYLGFLGRLSERYFQVYSSLPSLSSQLFLAVLTHLFSMGTFFMIGQGVGLDFPLLVYLVLVPPVLLLTLLPVSLAGWGVREGAMVAFFLLVGADKSRVLTFSVLYGVVALIASLPGLLVYLVRKDKS